jgi:hypothetical protein
VRANAVRALGHLARFAPLFVLLAPPADTPTLTWLDATARTLIARSNAGGVKVRWNACYGIASVMRNARLPDNVARAVGDRVVPGGGHLSRWYDTVRTL